MGCRKGGVTSNILPIVRILFNLYTQAVPGEFYACGKRIFLVCIESDLVRHVREVGTAGVYPAAYLHRFVHREVGNVFFVAQRIDDQYVHTPQFVELPVVNFPTSTSAIVLKSVR